MLQQMDSVGFDFSTTLYMRLQRSEPMVLEVEHASQTPLDSMILLNCTTGLLRKHQWMICLLGWGWGWWHCVQHRYIVCDTGSQYHCQYLACRQLCQPLHLNCLRCRICGWKKTTRKHSSFIQKTTMKWWQWCRYFKCGPGPGCETLETTPLWYICNQIIPLWHLGLKGFRFKPMVFDATGCANVCLLLPIQILVWTNLG